MALHPTLSELHFKKSVMKFLFDELKTKGGIELFFNPLHSSPRDASNTVLKQWVVVSFEARKLDTLASAFVLFTVFTREDTEGFENSRILDKISEAFVDEESTIGIRSVPLYDTTVSGSWVVIGGMLPIHRQTSGAWPGKEGTTIREVSYQFRWGAK